MRNPRGTPSYEPAARRLKSSRIAAGFRTAKEFSDKHGIPQSTYSLHENAKRGITRDAAVDYAHILGVSVDWLLTGRTSLTGNTDNDELKTPLREINIVGQVEAGIWREAVRWPQIDWQRIAIPVNSRYGSLEHFGLAVAGPSMDRLYPEGTIVVCVNLIELGRNPNNGERVICYRRDPHGLVEATVKEYVEHPDGSRWLWPRSNDPRFQQPTRIDQAKDHIDGDDLTIVALVVGSYRPE